MKTLDVAVLGEALIDFTDHGLSPSGTRLFEQNPGGAPANAACAVARLGGRAAFLGKVGDDMHGALLRDTLAADGVDVRGMVRDGAVFTTLAFVALGPGGERSFSFARKPGADTCLRPDEVAVDIIQNSRILQVGSLSLTDEPARSATLYAVEQARAAGTTVAYDPNYRPSLWPSEAAAVAQMRSLIPQADVMKISDEETALLTDEADPTVAARALLARGVAVVAVTLGGEGALVATGEGCRVVPGFPTDPVDTTGAGDAFWGAFLFRLAGSGKPPAALTLDEAAEFARFANAAAALCVGRRGAIPALPTAGQVAALLG